MSVPKLRFKEFAGGWKSFSLLDLSSDKTLNNGVFNDQNKVGKGYKLINVLDMYIDRDIDESRLSLLDLSKQEFERNKVKYGDIFFTRSSLVKEGIAYSNVYLGNSNDITYDGHLIKLSPNLEQINSIFLNYGLKTSKVRKQLIQGGKTATMTTIGQKEIASTKIDVPFLQEQTKIASFLSIVDEKIAQLSQKHQLLSQYKQGMMQKLFSQQIRFKADDGSIFGEWQKSYIGNVCKITTGNKDTQNKLNDGEYPFFVRSQTVERINSYSMDCEAILTSGDGVGVGKNYHYINGKFDFHQRVYCLHDFSNCVLGKYLYIYFSNFFYDRVKRLSAKNSVDSVRMDMISKMEMILPCLEEQTKIANFLSAIDQKIDVVSQQIKQAKQWKKGLLQQMFV